MSRKTLLLLGILLLLGVGTWWLNRRQASTTSTIDEERTAFTVADTAAIDKIFLAYKSGQQHTLQRVARNYWRIDNQYDVRPDRINQLLETLARQQVRNPVPRAARNSVIKDLATNGVKVEVYQRGELTKTLYIGSMSPDATGSYAILPNSEDPYVLHIPGFNGYLTPRYMIDKNGWRQVPIFRTPLPSLAAISVRTPGDPARTFTIRRSLAGQLTIDGNTPADSARLLSYAEQFGFINGQTFLDSVSRRAADSVLRTPPQYEVAVEARGSKLPAERVRLWPIPNERNGYYGISDRDPNEVLIAQRYVFNRVLVPREAFLKK